MSNQYKELLLNLVAQGHFPELWEITMKNMVQGIDIFAKEVHDVQWKFIGQNITEVLNGKQKTKT